MIQLRHTATVLAISASFCAMAQGKGEVQLHVAPQRGMAYVLDGKERLNNRALVLPAGEHRFTFWAPDRRILDTTLTIVADTSIAFYKTLEPTEAYLAYVNVQRKVKQQRLFYRAVPLLATAAAGLYTMSAVKKNNDTRAALVEAEERYSTLRDPGMIATEKRDVLPRLQEDHDAAYRNLSLGVIGTTAFALATVWGFIKAARIEDPVYEDRERIRFDGLVYVPGQRGGMLHAALTIPLAR